MKTFFKNKVISLIREVVNEDLEIEIEKPRVEAFGDFSTNIAMKLSKIYKKNPVNIAQEIASKLNSSFFSKIDVVAPGFINFFLSDEAFLSYFEELKNENFRGINVGNGKKILVEYGSINPTGPLHVGHGRVIVFGDVISSLLEYAGFKVQREYYLNDSGNQIDNLSESLYIRCKEELGSFAELSSEAYRGEYVKDMAKDFIATYGSLPVLSNDMELFRNFALDWCTANIKRTLKKMNIVYDEWVSERALYKKHPLKQIIKDLEKRDLAYEKEDAIWCRTTTFGDDKDRVAIKSDGNPAYYASDIVYSADKASRGFEHIITVLGFDHHGYVKRLESSFIFNNIKEFNTILVQMVQLFRGGDLIKMSKRSGEFYTLHELIEEIGGEVCKIFFLMRDESTPLDFDIDLAKEQSDQNPAHYIQYACARISSVMKKNSLESNDINYSLLNLKEEKEILKKIDEFYDLISSVLKSYDVHLLVTYLQDLSSLFHSYYNSNKIISEDKEKTKARIFFVSKIREVLATLLDIIGVKAVEKM